MNHDDIMTTIMRLEREIVALKAGLTLKPKQTLWDKRDSGSVNHRDGNYKEFFLIQDVKEALKEFMSEISDYWDKEALSQIAEKHFGEELLK